MGRIVASYLFPHPPVIVPGVGKGREEEARPTLDAMRRAARGIAARQPDVLLLMTPHAPAYGDYFRIDAPAELAGDLRSFGDRSPSLRFAGHAALAELLAQEAGRDALPAGPPLGSREARDAGVLDHGAVVPLRFLAEACGDGPRPALVRLSISGFDLASHYRYGQAAQRAVARLPDQDGRAVRVAAIASGDLSHCLKTEGPYGFDPEGPRFDALVDEAFRRADPAPLLRLTGRQREAAGECGLRSVVFLFGALDGRALRGEVLSHEGPFGVGYCIASLEDVGEAPSRLPAIEADEAEAGRARREKEGPLVALARAALERRVRGGKRIAPGEALEAARAAEERTRAADAAEQRALLGRPAGCFVSLHSPDGSLRGCIGTVFPQKEDLAREIAANAESAALRDPRFPAVRAEELDGLSMTVDVMGAPEPVASPAELDAVRYGVIVRKGFRSGLLLPDLEGVGSVVEQLSIALRKAGIGPDEDYAIERFSSRRFA